MKFWQFAKREFLNRRLPHGLVSPRYLLPGQPPKVRIHCQLWLQGLPRIPLPFYLLMEGFLYMRWVLFSSWRFSFRAVRHWGFGIRDRDGIGILRQFMRVLSMAILHSIPPSEIYAFRLYGPDRFSRVWDYVFTHELPAFHQWRDLQYGKTGNSAQALGDKKETIETLSRQGVPVVPILAAIEPGENMDPSPWLTFHPRLFLKPCHGSAGRGCFVVEKNGTDSGFSVFETRAGMITFRSTKARLKSAASRETYLMQPLMLNHPELAGLCETQDAVTVRIITEAPKEQTVKCYSAMLEIPGPLNDPETGRPLNHQKRFHIIVPMNMKRGKTTGSPPGQYPFLASTRYRTLYERAQNRCVPFWDQIRKNAILAHSLFPDVYAIAWDYVITPEGPFLLEGNTGWDTRMPQIFCGGLLELYFKGQG